jgi:hypothetical protein
MLGLLLNTQRVETRRSYGTLQAIRNAFTQSIGPEYFHALYDDEDEAEAMYTIYKARVESESAEQENSISETP